MGLRLGYLIARHLVGGQWAAAALQPPHLAAIAPWEGLLDCYREVIMRGGIPDTKFHDKDIVAALYGESDSEDVTAHTTRFPLMNAYWADKRADLDSITIPAYVVATWTSAIHCHGTLRAFREISSAQKWLRVHNIQEWIDLADGEAVTEYAGDDLSASVTFTTTFEHDVEITGYLNLHLWVEAADGDDMDLFAAVYKESPDGKRQHHFTMPAPSARAFTQSLERDGKLPGTLSYTGPLGRLRVSHREVLGGSFLGRKVAVLDLPGGILDMPTRNRGTHRIRTGATYDSHLLLPVIPCPRP